MKKCTRCHAPCTANDQRCPFCGGPLAKKKDYYHIGGLDRQKRIQASCVVLLTTVTMSLCNYVLHADLVLSAIMGGLAAAAGWVLGWIVWLVLPKGLSA
jgi:hypothetical protein